MNRETRIEFLIQNYLKDSLSVEETRELLDYCLKSINEVKRLMEENKMVWIAVED